MYHTASHSNSQVILLKILGHPTELKLKGVTSQRGRLLKANNDLKRSNQSESLCRIIKIYSQVSGSGSLDGFFSPPFPLQEGFPSDEVTFGAFLFSAPARFIQEICTIYHGGSVLHLLCTPFCFSSPV